MTEKKYPISLEEVEPEYQELSGRMNYDGSRYLPRILKKAFTVEQARVALEFYASPEEIANILGISTEELPKDRDEMQKAQIEAIAKKLDLDEETVDKHIRYMFEMGFAFPTRRGWRFARNMMQAKDSQTNPKFDEQLGDEYFDLWEAFQKVEAYPTWYPLQFPQAEEYGPLFRVIPARKSLEMSNIAYEDIVPEDNFEELLKPHATIAVEHCPCKRLVRDRACHSPTEVCLIFDRVAEHNLNRDAARIISVEEALAISDMATEYGMFCSSQGNAVNVNMVCHCHWCCCDDILPAIMHNFPVEKMVAASCYKAVVDPNKCIGCQTCLTRCQFEAIEMKRYPGAGRQDKLRAWVNPEKCRGCGLCVITCPAEARTMKQVKTGEDIPKERVIPSTYTSVPLFKEGKHLETGSVVTRPAY